MTMIFPLLISISGCGLGPGGLSRRIVLRLNNHEEFLTNIYIRSNMHREMIISLYTNLLQNHIHILQDDQSVWNLNISD